MRSRVILVAGPPARLAQARTVLEEGFLADGAEHVEARRSATLTLAVIRGLLLDLHALDDSERVDAAHELFVELLRSCLLPRVAQ